MKRSRDNHIASMVGDATDGQTGTIYNDIRNQKAAKLNKKNK